MSWAGVDGGVDATDVGTASFLDASFLESGDQLLACVDEHADAYAAWMQTQVHPSETPDEAEARTASLWTGVRIVMSTALARGLSADPADWTMRDLDALIEDLTDVGRDVADPGLGESFTPSMVIVFALYTYVSFLGETHRWRGTAAAWALARARLAASGLPDDLVDDATAGSRVDVDEATTTTALMGLPLVADLLDVLTPLVTAERPPEGADVLTPRMADVPLLRVMDDAAPDGQWLAVSHLSVAACACGLLEPDEEDVLADIDLDVGQDVTGVHLTAVGRRVQASPSEAGVELSEFVRSWVMVGASVPLALTSDPALQQALATMPTAATMAVLGRGLTKDPVTERDLTGLLRALTRRTPTAVRRQTQEVLRAAVSRLVRAGLLDSCDGRYVITRGVEPLVLSAVAMLTADADITDVDDGVAMAAGRA